MAKRDLKIVGFTISISFLMFIIFGLWLLALQALISTWVKANAVILLIVLSILILIGVITGTLSLRAMTSKGKGMLG